MFGRILKHEWRALTADATVWAIAAIFAAAIGYGVWNGGRWVTFQRGALQSAAAEESARYDRLKAQVAALSAPGAKVSPFADPRSPSNLGGRLGPRYAMLPPGPLAPLAIGQSDLLPYYFKVSTDARENIVTATEIENPNRLLAGRFDLAFVIIFLYPLLILALTYNMLSSEQEQGTLSLALSQPVSLRTMVSGKVALRALVLLALLVAFSAAALAVTGADLSAPGAATRLSLWLAIVAAYGAFWFALSIAVAALGKNSTTNATILASAWLVLIVMTPSLFNLMASVFYPVPSRVEMVQATRVAQDEANKGGAQALARFYDDHPELATGDPAQAMNDFNVVRVAVNDEVERRVRPVVDRYEAQLAKQQGMMDSLRFLSPAILMQGALNDIAGTGTERHRDYLAQVDAYHQRWRDYFVPKIFAKALMADFDAIPRFEYREEPTGAVAARVAMALAGLLIPAVAIAVFGLRRLGRFAVI
ncbi:MAG: ABC transporter permease [Acidimicrobiia bacterium]